MKSNIKVSWDKWIRENLPYIIVFAIILIFELIFYRPAHDEVALKKEFFHKYDSLTFSTVVSFLKGKFIRDVTGWSSRFLINSVSNFLVLFPCLWYLINALMFVLMYYSLVSLFETRDKDIYVLVFVLILSVPQVIFTSAGLLITTIAYFWPMACVSYLLSYICKKNRGLSVFSIAFSILAVLYAANEELISAFLVIMLLYSIIAYKGFRRIIIPYEAISFAELIWALVSPGNSARSKAELIWFADFNNLSLIKKIEMGFSSTMNEFFLTNSLITVTFTALLMITYFYNKKRNIFEKIIATLPFGFALFGVMISDLATKYPRISDLYHCMTSYGSISVKNYGAKRSYLPVILFVFFGGLILILTAALDDYSRNSIGVALALLMSVGSRSMMGLSPTIWASGLRTFSVVYYTIVFALVWLLRQLRINGDKSLLYIIWLTYMSAVEIGGFIVAL